MGKKTKRDVIATLETAMGKEEVFGKTILDCLEQLSQKVVIKGYSSLTVDEDGKKYTLRLSPIQIRRFLVNKNYKEVLAKRFELVLR